MDSNGKCYSSCGKITTEISNKDNFLSIVVFHDEATLHLSGTANLFTMKIIGLENPHKSSDYTKDVQDECIPCDN
jgi:hypothetical protein